MTRFLRLVARPAVLLPAGALVLAWIAYLAIFRWNAEAMITRRQEKLLQLVSDKRWRKCEPFLSETYEDQWGFDKADALLSLKDVGSQFLVLHIVAKDPALVVEGKTARAEAILRVSGSGSAVAQLVIAEANRLEAPFVFHWRKESWAPAGWRVFRIENPALTDLRGYEPGSLTRALRDPGALTP